MKYLVIVFIALGASLSMMSGSKPIEVKALPISAVRESYKSELFEFLASLDQCIQLLENKSTFDEVEKSFLLMRSEFKQVEFMIAYLDPEQYNKYINGAPLPKIMKKVPDFTVIEPNGLQRIEELIYEETLAYDDLIDQCLTLKKNVQPFLQPVRINQLTDPVVFEAIRYGLLRMNTMGITGFDSPGNTDKSLLETAYSLESVQKTMNFYASFINTNDLNKFNELCKNAIEKLKGHDFEDLDRAALHKEALEPLWRITLEIQHQLYIELPHQRSNVPNPVNYSAESLFSDDFLNVSYYAEYSDLKHEAERIELGKLLFFDPILSASNERACASCHRPDKGFSDGLARATVFETMEPGKRNSPTVLNSVFAERYFHDLRVDRLAFQMDHVVLNPEEFATDYSEIINKLNQSEEYQQLFQKGYGTEGISKNTVTNAVTRYVASLHSFNSEFDRFMRGELETIDPAVVRGYNLFTGKASCATCHFAPTFAGLVPPNFTESESEVLGVPKSNQKPYELDDDPGRYMNRLIKEQADFYKHSFKTPTVRNVALTAPYMHNGVFETLEEVIDFYDEGGGLGAGFAVAHQTLPEDSLKLSDQEKKDLVRFMESLTDTTGMNSMPSSLPTFAGKSAWNDRVIGGKY